MPCASALQLQTALEKWTPEAWVLTTCEFQNLCLIVKLLQFCIYHNSSEWQSLLLTGMWDVWNESMSGKWACCCCPCEPELLGEVGRSGALEMTVWSGN